MKPACAQHCRPMASVSLLSFAVLVLTVHLFFAVVIFDFV
jgi:hypothetical protein